MSKFWFRVQIFLLGRVSINANFRSQHLWECMHGYACRPMLVCSTLGALSFSTSDVLVYRAIIQYFYFSLSVTDDRRHKAAEGSVRSLLVSCATF